MEQKYIDLNNQLNRFLQKSLSLEQSLEDPDTIKIVQSITNKVAINFLRETGLGAALKQFWAERKSL